MANRQLVIVESPTKAKKIQSYLGKEYLVLSSEGHIADLKSSFGKDKPTKEKWGVDPDNNFAPEYTVIKGKKEVVGRLKKESGLAQETILATDEDREGEAIAWHLCRLLGLDLKTTKRIVYREVTKEAILVALNDPRLVDQNLVDAQQARRVLDRLVGFELSEMLWKKVKHGLSAGRVQSVATKLIAEKEAEVKKFKPARYFRPTAIFRQKDGGQDIKTELNCRLETVTETRQFLNGLDQKKWLVVEYIQGKVGFRRPPPPFKTSSLQQEASAKLSMTPKRTMSVAQKLYESGHITYMRTDSLSLSQDFINQTADYIKNEPTLGSEYSKPQNYSANNKSAQEAHEAIRPTTVGLDTPSGLDSSQASLYRLIRQRSLASQMSPARFLNSQVSIGSERFEPRFIAKGSQLEFAGFLKIGQKTPDDVILPKLEEGESLVLVEIEANEKISQPPARYNEASLIGQLEDLGIGRPSTYAPTIATVIDRGYVVKGDIEPETIKTKGFIYNSGRLEEYDRQESFAGAKNKLLITDLGQLVTRFLAEHFKEIMDYGFTSNIEDEFDKIAVGNLQWQSQVGQFYDQFKPILKTVENIDKKDINPEKFLGNDPKDNQPVVARLGRFGPMLQKGETGQKEKPLFAPLPDGQTLETVDLQSALKMFGLPKNLGQNEAGQDVWVKRGPFGPYVEVDKRRVSIKEGDPLSLDLSGALEILANDELARAKKIIKEFAGGIQIIEGRYGPYVSDGRKNGRLPKDSDLKTISLKDVQEILAKAKTRPKGKRGPGRKK